MKDKIKIIADKAISAKVFPGCVIGIIKTGKTSILPFGNYTYSKITKKMEEESIFDIASITKAIPTSSLALYYIDQGKLKLEDSVIKYIPDLKSKYKEQIQIKHLLTQTLYYENHHLSALKDKTPMEIINAIKNLELNELPGSSYAYTNTTSIMLGWIIEVVGGKSIDELADNVYFNPLNMNKTSYYPEKFPLSDIVPTEEDEWRGRLIHGEIHDESAWKLSQIKKVGSAGLFSTVPDLIKFCRMLLNNGKSNDTIFLSGNIIKEIYTNQLYGSDFTVGLGWELAPKIFMGKNPNLTTFGKTGFTGCSVVCNIPDQTCLIILSNRIYPKRQNDASLINSFRSVIADIVFD